MAPQPLRRRALLVILAAAASAACCLVSLRGGLDDGSATFLQMAALRGASTPQVAGLSLAGLPATPEPAAPARSCASHMAIGLFGVAAVSAALKRRSRSAPFAGGSVEVIASQNSIGAFDGHVRVEPRTAMAFVIKRKFIRNKDKKFNWWVRCRRPLKSAATRFLIKEDGTVWRKQAGLRHLKSKKSPAHLRRLRRMVRVKPKYTKLLWRVLKYRAPKMKASDYIMRKFNKVRLHHGEGMSDRGTGTALWTGPGPKDAVALSMP